MNNAAQGKDQKYFFNANIFDEGHVDEAPAPTFSEDQLAEVQKKSALEGRQQGLKEAETSQLKQTAIALEKISAQLIELSAAESLREKIYEKETLQLCLAIFERLFPLYNKQNGFAELQDALSAIMKAQEGQNHIVVTVTPDVVDAVENHLNSLKSSGHDLRFAVKGDETLSAGACRLAWNEGGALRDPQRLADEIRQSLEQVLAKKGLKGHDSTNNPAPGGETVL